MPVIFITGIDTGTGKTIAAGLAARFLRGKGKSVITQKLVQTGGSGISEDIALHRKIMGIELNSDDRSGLTSPYVLQYPASPHLSAAMENTVIDTEKISRATADLAEKYDFVIIEGAGGIYVPLNENISTIDYIERMGYPVLIVTSHRLGSINHTLLTLEAAWARGITVLGLLYNTFPPQCDAISRDSSGVMAHFMKKRGIGAPLIVIPEIDLCSIQDIDFSGMFRDFL